MAIDKTLKDKPTYTKKYGACRERRKEDGTTKSFA